MQLTHYKTSSASGSEISFPQLECWNSLSKVATIAATINKNRVLCRISLQILQDNFGASESKPMESVVLHRKTLQAAARKLIEQGAYEEDGSITIQAKDL